MGTNKNLLAFTLVEMVVVIGVIAILLSLVLMAINPARHFSQAHNSKRKSDVIAILNAVSQYMVDFKGVPPPEITQTVKRIAKNGADICEEIIGKNYIHGFPSDPTENNGQITDCSSLYDTGYTIVKDVANRITVATDPANEELGQHIWVTR